MVAQCVLLLPAQCRLSMVLQHVAAVALLRGPWVWCRGSCLGFQDLPAMGLVAI